MKNSLLISELKRRDVLIGFAAWSAFLTLSPQLHAADDNGWKKAIDTLTKGAKPSLGKISLQFPDLAQNGHMVPFTVSVDSDMSAPQSSSEFVTALHLYAKANKAPEIASIYFTPFNTKAEIASRMRLNKTQDIVAVAQMGDGKFYMAERQITVAVSDCFC